MNKTSFKVYQTTIDRIKLLGIFQTEEEAQEEKTKVEKEGVGIVSIKRSENKKK